MIETIFNDGMCVPIKSWVSNLENSALEQSITLAKLPFIKHHVALMPDAHGGMGCCIGSVFATNNEIIPSSVGVDIGCGMCALPLNIKANKEIADLAANSIMRNIPLGFSAHPNPQEWDGFNYESLNEELTREIQEESPYKLGTLGGGNHFIELQQDKSGQAWLMVHSGSRNIGHKIATFYVRLAKKLNPCEFDKSLSWLYADSEEGKNYLNDMNWALEYAFENRKRMMGVAVGIFLACMEMYGNFPPINWDEMINIHHNYVAQETHFGEKVWVHRKGATLASKGTVGIIPGDMGSHSYIVRGLGNAESFNSCSHGAGRAMSRTKAREVFTEKEVADYMRDLGVAVYCKGGDFRDESHGAYKDIAQVMENQKDLVEIVHGLKPLAVVKA